MVRTCLDDGCDRTEIAARGMCRKHYARWYRIRPEVPRCYADLCQSPPYVNGLCALHDGRLRRTGSPTGLKRVQHQWRRIDRQGYMMVRKPGHPTARKNWIAEHRLVMEETLGRCLLPGENVHHINGSRLDNRSENLELWVSSQPSGQRIEEVVVWAKEILSRYDPSSLVPPQSPTLPSVGKSSVGSTASSDSPTVRMLVGSFN